MAFVWDVAVNVVANIIAAILIVLTSSAIVYFGFVRRHRRFLDFFGVGSENPALCIYVSRLDVVRGGAMGLEQDRQGYYGPAIARNEYRAALFVRDAMRLRILGILPTGLRQWLGEQNATLRDIDPPIDISPTSLDELPAANLIAIGGDLYNAVTRHYWTFPSVRFYFDRDGDGKSILKVRQSGVTDIEIPRSSLNRELAVIVRIREYRPNRTILLCLGSDSSATYGGMKFLIESWRDLEREYRGSEFGICLAFPGQPKNVDYAVTPTVVYSYRVDAD